MTDQPQTVTKTFLFSPSVLIYVLLLIYSPLFSLFVYFFFLLILLIFCFCSFVLPALLWMLPSIIRFSSVPLLRSFILSLPSSLSSSITPFYYHIFPLHVSNYEQLILHRPFASARNVGDTALLSTFIYVWQNMPRFTQSFELEEPPVSLLVISCSVWPLSSLTPAPFPRVLFDLKKPDVAAVCPHIC